MSSKQATQDTHYADETLQRCSHYVGKTSAAAATEVSGHSVSKTAASDSVVVFDSSSATEVCPFLCEQFPNASLSLHSVTILRCYVV